MQPENKYPPLELNSVLSLKKHRGKTLKEVIDTDIDYFVWMIRPDENMKGKFLVSGEVMNYYRDKVREERGTNIGYRHPGAQRRFG